MSRALGLLLVAAVFFTPSRASADPSDYFADADPTVVDWSVMGLGLGTAIAFRLWEPDPYDRQGTSPGFDIWARDAFELRNPGTVYRLADVFLYTEVGAALLLPLVVEHRFDDDVGNATLLGLQSLLVTYALTGMVKDFVRRSRPDADVNEHQSHMSFFSGHTSMSFAGATMVAIYAEEFDWGGRASPAIGALALAVAGTTGLLRVAGRRHWLSDVVTGALVGTATSLIVLRLHSS